MAEYIERELVAEPFDCGRVTVNGELYLRHRDIAEFLNGIHSADVVEVVRCKDCERRSKSADLTDTVYCPWLKQQMRKTDFCSYGEKRDNNATEGY